MPYKVDPSDQKKGSKYFVEALSRLLPSIQSMSPADWNRIRTAYRVDNRLLKNWSNSDLLKKAFRKEELAYTEDLSGYDDWVQAETGLDEMDYWFVHDDEDQPFFTGTGVTEPISRANSAFDRASGKSATSSSARRGSARTTCVAPNDVCRPSAPRSAKR